MAAWFGLLLLAGGASAQMAPSSLRIWATDSLAHGIEEGVKPVIAGILCAIPFEKALDGETFREGPVELAVTDFRLSGCYVREFIVRNEQGGIFVKISGLFADVRGAVVARQADCNFFCAGPMDARFTADMRDSDVEVWVSLVAIDGKPAVRAEYVSTDIHLENIQLENQGLTPFAHLVSGAIEKVTNRAAERMVRNIVNKTSAVIQRLPWHGLPVGRLVGDAIPRLANLKFDIDVNYIQYGSPAWWIDVLTVLYSPPQVGPRSYPYAPTPLSSYPPREHRSQQLIGTASPWGINQALFTLEQLGLFSTQFQVDAHGTRVPVTLSTSPSLAVRGQRAQITLKTTFAGPSERTNSTILLGADSPRLMIVEGTLLKAKVSGMADVRAEVKGCGVRTASIRHSPLPGSAIAAAQRPEIAVDLRSEQRAPWWVVECDSPGGNLLMSALGLNNVQATGTCIRQGLTGEAASSETLQCIINVWSSQIDLLYRLVTRVQAVLSADAPHLLSFLWDLLVAVLEEIIERSPGGESRAADVRALHACVEQRTQNTDASETCRCLIAAAGPAIDATYPTILDMRSLVLTPALDALADEVFAGTAPSTAPAVLARVNQILSRQTQPIQQVLDQLVRILHDVLAAVSESAGSERTDALIAALRPLVPVLWSSVQRMDITSNGSPIGDEYNLSDLDALIDRVLEALTAGRSFEWYVTGVDADVVGIYTRSGVGYVLHPPPTLFAEINVDAVFAAASHAMEGLAPSASFPAVHQNSRVGSLWVGYRADASGFDYMAEADWRAIAIKLLETAGTSSPLAYAVRLLPVWVDKFVGGWADGYFWGSLDIGIDGDKLLTVMPFAMEEIFEARYTRELARILQL